MLREKRILIFNVQTFHQRAFFIPAFSYFKPHVYTWFCAAIHSSAATTLMNSYQNHKCLFARYTYSAKHQLCSSHTIVVSFELRPSIAHWHFPKTARHFDKTGLRHNSISDETRPEALHSFAVHISVSCSCH